MGGDGSLSARAPPPASSSSSSSSSSPAAAAAAGDGSRGGDAGEGARRRLRVRPRLCQHADPNCAVAAVRGGLRGLVAGFGLRAVLALAGLAAGVLRRRGRAPREGWVAALLDATVRNGAALRLGACLAHINVGFRGTLCGLRALRGKDDGWNAAAAGAVAGTAMGFFESAELTTYVLVRALEAAWRAAEARGMVRSHPLGDTALFAAASATLFYGFLVEPDALRTTYLTWLYRVGEGRDLDRDLSHRKWYYQRGHGQDGAGLPAHQHYSKGPPGKH